MQQLLAIGRKRRRKSAKQLIDLDEILYCMTPPLLHIIYSYAHAHIAFLSATPVWSNHHAHCPLAVNNRNIYASFKKSIVQCDTSGRFVARGALQCAPTSMCAFGAGLFLLDAVHNEVQMLSHEMVRLESFSHGALAQGSQIATDGIFLYV